MSQKDDYPERIRDIEEIESCWSVAGEESYILKVRVATPADLEELLARVRAAANVSTRTTIVLSHALREPPHTLRIATGTCPRWQGRPASGHTGEAFLTTLRSSSPDPRSHRRVRRVIRSPAFLAVVEPDTTLGAAQSGLRPVRRAATL